MIDGFVDEAVGLGMSKEAATKMAMGLPQDQFGKFMQGIRQKAQEFQKGYNSQSYPQEVKLKPKTPPAPQNATTPGAGKSAPKNTKRAPKVKPNAIVPRNANVVPPASSSSASQANSPRLHNTTTEAQATKVLTPDEVISPSKGTAGAKTNSPKLNNQVIDIESSPAQAAPAARAGLPQANPTNPQAAPQPTSAAGNFVGGVKQKATNAWQGAKNMANNVVNKFNAARAGQGGGGAPPTPPTGGGGVPPAGGSPAPGASNLAKGVGTAGKVLTGLGSAAAGLNALNEFSDGNYGKGAVSTGQAAMPAVAKILAQSAPRAIPFVGSGLSLGSAYNRFKDNDYLGAGIDTLAGLSSGAGGVFPIIAPVTSPLATGLTGANAVRDIYKGFNQPDSNQGVAAGAQGVVNAMPAQAKPGTQPAQTQQPSQTQQATQSSEEQPQPHTLNAQQLDELYQNNGRQPIISNVPLPQSRGSRMPSRAGAIGTKSPGMPSRGAVINAQPEAQQPAAPAAQTSPSAAADPQASTETNPPTQAASETIIQENSQPQDSTQQKARTPSHYERGAQVLNQGVRSGAITPAQAQASISRMPGEERERAKMISAGGSPAAVDAWLKEKASRGTAIPKTAEFDAILEFSVSGFKKMAEELGVDDAFARGMLSESLVELYKQAETKILESRTKKAKELEESEKIAAYLKAWEGFREQLVKEGANEAFIEGMLKESDDMLNNDRHRIVPFMSNSMLGTGGGALLGSAISRGLSDDDDDGPGISSILLPMAGAVAGQHFLPKLMNSWKDSYGVGANAGNPLTAAHNKANPVLSAK